MSPALTLVLALVSSSSDGVHYSSRETATPPRLVADVSGNTPAVNITGPAEGAVFLSGEPITFTGTASDAEDGFLSADLAWSSSRDGDLGTGAWHTFTPSEGSHAITATATDSDGATASAQITLRVMPSAPLVTISAPPAGTKITLGDGLTFTGTALDATDGDLSAALKWISDLDGLIGLGSTITTSSSQLRCASAAESFCQRRAPTTFTGG